MYVSVSNGTKLYVCVRRYVCMYVKVHIHACRHSISSDLVIIENWLGPLKIIEVGFVGPKGIWPGQRIQLGKHGQFQRVKHI